MVSHAEIFSRKVRTIAFSYGIIGILRGRGGDSAESANGLPFLSYKRKHKCNFPMCGIAHVRILGVFYPPESGDIRIYIRFVESGKSEARRGGASEKCIWAYVYSFKKVVRLHFPRCRLRDPSKISIIPKGNQCF